MKAGMFGLCVMAWIAYDYYQKHYQMHDCSDAANEAVALIKSDVEKTSGFKSMELNHVTTIHSENYKKECTAIAKISLTDGQTFDIYNFEYQITKADNGDENIEITGDSRMKFLFNYGFKKPQLRN